MEINDRLQQQYDDRQMLNDALYSQKQVTENYNTFANECSGQQIREVMLNILNEEHQIQADVFDEMSKRGWYAPQNAQQEQIQQAKTKFQNIQSEL